MRHVGKTRFLRDLVDPERGILQQLLGLCDPHTRKQVKKTLIRFPVQQFGQVPLAHVYMVRHA